MKKQLDIKIFSAMAKTAISPGEQVDQYIKQLQPDLQQAVNLLRNIILSTSPEIKEHIKWNSPAFYYDGEMETFNPKEYKRDLLVMNLRNKRIMAVLPTGAVIRTHTDILEGNYTDGRRMINFSGLEDIQLKAESLRELINEWIALIDR